MPQRALRLGNDDGKFPVLLAAAHDILRAVLRYLVRRGELFRPRSCALSGRGGIRRFGTVRHQPHALELFRCGAYLTHRAAEVARGGGKGVPAPIYMEIYSSATSPSCAEMSLSAMAEDIEFERS